MSGPLTSYQHVRIGHAIEAARAAYRLHSHNDDAGKRAQGRALIDELALIGLAIVPVREKA